MSRRTPGRAPAAAALVAVALSVLLAACGSGKPDAAAAAAGDTGQRIVAFDMAGSIADTIAGLGMADEIVGRDIAADFPGSDDVAIVTKEGHSINAEAVLALNPTLVITDGSIGPRDVVEQLADTGVRVEFVDNDSSFAGAAQLARDVAGLLGVPEKGDALASKITTDVDDVTARIRALVPATPLRMVFLYLRGQSGVYYLFGDETGAGDLIQHVGGVDVAREKGWGELTPLTDEAIVAAKPDVILTMTGGIESVGGIDGLLSSKPAIALTPAGKARRFVSLPDTEILSFGPRSAEVLADLAEAVYGRAP